MAKRRRGKRRKSSRAKRADRRPLSPKELGQRAFKQGEFAAAIEHWDRLDAGEDATVCAGLAEAHFRRGLAAHQQPGQAMDDLLKAQPSLGPQAPMLRNLAIACEALEAWEEAAEAWGTLLGTLPRRAAKKEPGGIPVTEQRAWLRRRSAENFQRAGPPGPGHPLLPTGGQGLSGRPGSAPGAGPGPAGQRAEHRRPQRGQAHSGPGRQAGGGASASGRDTPGAGRVVGGRAGAAAGSGDRSRPAGGPARHRADDDIARGERV